MQGAPLPIHPKSLSTVSTVDIILLTLIGLSVGYYLVSSYYTGLFFLRGEPLRERDREQLPPVSVIKPVTSAEAEQVENFISFFEQDYPCFEVVFALSRGDTEVVSVLEDLSARFSRTNIRWVLVDQNRGPNYKVGNLIAAIQAARHETLVMSDSDMRVKPDYLRRVVTALQNEDAEVVTCLYRAIHIDGIPSALHALTVQNDFIPNVILGYWIEGISYAFGATICTRKRVLDGFGGLEPLKDYLADDYQIGHLAHQAGYKVHLLPHLIDHAAPSSKFGAYFFHQLRWAITQRVCRPWGYLASGFTHGVSLATVYLIAQGFSLQAIAVFALTVAARLFCFTLLNRRVVRNREVTHYAWLILAKDWLNSVIWLLSFFIDSVRWKERRFRVVRGGRMYELNEGGEL